MESWKMLMDEERGDNNDTSPLVAVFPADLNWEAKFDNDFGSENGVPFTAWTEQRVYFPVRYDGSEWVGSAPRNPEDEALYHRGG